MKNVNTTSEYIKSNSQSITVKSVLKANIDVIWPGLQKVNNLIYVCKPLIYFSFKENFHHIFRQEDNSILKMKLYGFIPLGKHNIFIEKIDNAEYKFRSREKGDLLKQWNHLIAIKRLNDNETLYTDQIDIYAGCMTNIVAWWAKKFYRHRQKRWITLLNNNNVSENL